MDSSIDLSRAPAVKGVRTALVVAVTASAMAGLVHAAAVGGHDGDRTLMWMFGLCAAAQLAWAAAAVMRPTRRVLALGLVINGGALLVWALSRTVGISFIESLAEREVVGTQDLVAALFAAASVVAALCILARPTVRTVITPAWTGILAAFALLATMPALTAGHTHEQGDDHTHLEAAGLEHAEAGGEHARTEGNGHGGAEGHEAGEDHADDPAHATGDDHATGADPATGADHATGAGHAGGPTGDLANHTPSGSTGHDEHPTTPPPATGGPPTTGGGHGGHPDDPVDPPGPTGPIISLDDPRLTAAQRAIATKLIADARTGLNAFVNVAAVEAAGYVSIGDGGTNGYEHYVKWSYLTDAYELDPAHMESIVVKKNEAAPKTIVSAMYILTPGKTMDDTPPLAGELTSWHEHRDLCFEGPKLVAIAVGGVCPRGVLTVTPPMLHVWMIPQPCGPFAGIESLDGGACGSHSEH